MTFYDGRYPFYPTSRIPVGFNTIEIVIIIIFLVFLVSFFIILIGIRGADRFHWLARITLSLFIGVVIVAVNFSNSWERASATVNTTYKSFSSVNINAEVGIHVGFSGVNVTLRGVPEIQQNETINYNEEFLWKSGSSYAAAYRDGLERGLPDPILYIAEKFTPTSPCGVFSQYKASSHYASATMWVALVAWMLANILLWLKVPLYGAYMILVTGSFMIFSLISFGSTRKTKLCAIMFDDMKLDSALGPSFWLTLATALLTLIIGITIMALSIWAPQILSKVFVLTDSSDDEDTAGEDFYNVHYLENDKPTDVPMRTLENVV